MANKKAVEIVFNRVHDALQKAVEEHPPIKSHHEGFAVIKEELDELWDAIKKDDLFSAAHEAEQVAAMACRFLLDLYEIND